jgi:tetratricopeptide (TPR) repeat protein
VRSALRTLDPRNADRVAQHLVVAGTLVDEDPDEALAHARAARDRASRIAAVREAVGVAAYHAGDYAEAARELRAYRRMTGDESYRSVLADCERALGRPEIALRLVHEALAAQPDAEETAELQLVEAGARRDLGETPAARLILESALGGRPRPEQLTGAGAGVLRLAAAYADLLRDQGEDAAAAEWFAALAVADADDITGVGTQEDVEFGEEELVAEESEDSEQDDGLEDDDEREDDELEDDELEDDELEDDELEDDELEDDAGPVGGGRSFAAEVEAEVAELLGETGDGDEDGSGAPEGTPAEH